MVVSARGSASGAAEIRGGWRQLIDAEVVEFNPERTGGNGRERSLVCEHLTFVTCRTCGKTYDQRVEEARRGQNDLG
jgi:hypothetical protein